MTGLLAQALVVFLHGTLIDGSGRPPRADVAIEVRAGRITAIGSASDYAVPPGATVHDVRGKWVLPGLIDAHTHLFDSGSLYTSPDDYDLTALVPHVDERRAILDAMPKTLERYLCSGITSVGSLGGARWEIDRREETAAPRISTAGPFLTSFPVGEMTLWTDEDPVLVRIETPERARAEVRSLAMKGVDLIKVGVAGAGVAGNELEAYRPTLEALVEAAHGKRLRVAIHAEELAVAKMAIRAGVDVLAHTVNDRLVDDEFLQLARSRDVVTITGLAHFDRYRDVLDGTVTLLEIEERCGDPRVVASWRDLETIPAASRPEMPPAIAWASSDDGREILRSNVQRMASAGIRIAAGSNGGNVGTLQGPSFHRELYRLADAGLPLAAVVSAATLNAARALGVDANRGSVAVGKLADLLVLAKDPLQDVSNFEAVDAVFVSGVLVYPSPSGR